MAGAFFTVAVAAVVVYFFSAQRPDIRSSLAALGFVLTASLLGKLIGMGIARIKILWLRRVLERRLTSAEVSHIHLH